MVIEPIFGSLRAVETGWDESGELLGYRAVSESTGKVLGLGESREEAIINACRSYFPQQMTHVQ